MTLNLTAKEAAALGLNVSKGVAERERKPGSRAPSQPRTAYHTRCRVCAVEFTTVATEDRHLADTGHRAYELVIERSTP